MLKPEMLKALPDEDYENLKKQFFALKKLCESKIHQCQIYSKKLSEYDRESVIARNEALNSEREMNAQLTAELEKVEQRCAELESENKRLMNCVIHYGDVDSNRKSLNKFALEQKIEAVENLAQTVETISYKHDVPDYGYQYNKAMQKTMINIFRKTKDVMVEQLRKEQDNAY
jgi:small-conductance mechanosensitive channel